MSEVSASIATDARIARQALHALADSDAAGIVRPTLRDVAVNASDEALAKLRRMLK